MNLPNYFPEKYEEEAYKLADKISDELLKNQAGNLQVSPKDDNSKFILEQLHKSRAIYIYDSKRKTEDLTCIKDKNYKYLEAFLEGYEFVNLKNTEIRLMLQKYSKNAKQYVLLLCGEGRPLALKKFSKGCIPLHAFSLILALPDRALTCKNLNNRLKELDLPNFKEINNFNTLVNDDLEIHDAHVKQQVESICKKFNKKDFVDLFFEVTTDTIKYVPFYPNF